MMWWGGIPRGIAIDWGAGGAPPMTNCYCGTQNNNLVTQDIYITMIQEIRKQKSNL